MAGDKGSEGDMMAVAVFCLEQTRGALAIDWAQTRDAWTDFDAVERYTLHADHVYKSCRILNSNWPSPFVEHGGARRSANAFVERWNEARDLGHAYAHYEDALIRSNHDLRGETNQYIIVRGVEVSDWEPMYVAPVDTGAPLSVRLLGRVYRLHGVHEALTELEREFAAVLVDADTGKLREDA